MQRKNLKGKKLLVLGGVYQHCKLVEAAHELGVTVIVDDYLPPEQAPAKQIADKFYMHNIMDVDEIVEMCKAEKVDGVIATSLDACQRPYQKICEKLNLPCFGTAQQYKILTDKNEFKKYCRLAGVDVIPEYQAEDFANEKICDERVEFPVFVKPCDSRGSRGQSICHTYRQAVEGIAGAIKESETGKFVVEKYMGQKNDFSMTVLVINGKAYPFRTVDRILGKYEDGLDKLAVGATMPSVYTDLYMSNVHAKIEKFVSLVGLVNAPMFMQGFVDGDTVRFYDPGLRYPGGEYERVFKTVMGKDLFYPLIEFAITGSVSTETEILSRNDIWLDGKLAVQVLPTLREGKIANIEGIEKICDHKNVVGVFARYAVGDQVFETHNVNQRFCEIDLICDDENQASDLVQWVYDTLKITDEEGRDMIVSRFDPSQLRKSVK